MEQEFNETGKKENLKAIIIFSLIVIVSLTFFYFLVSKKIETNSTQQSSDLPAFEETNDEETSYVLKEYNGKIGIYENDSLIYTLDTYLFTLPEKDKKLLSEGISVSSKEELYEILEEYY